MKSMTGFGRAVSSRARKKKSFAGEIEISLKTVNGRFLEIRVHAPREYAPLENEFKAAIAKVVARGTVDLFVNRRAEPKSPRVSVNFELAKAWVKSFTELGKTLHVAGLPTLEILTGVPEIFRVDFDLAVGNDERREVRKLLADAVEACDDEREREGESISRELTRLCSELDGQIESAEGLKAEARVELDRRLRARLSEQLEKYAGENKFDEQRLAHELVIQLDRSDISEELTRLREHLKAYRGLLKSREPQGKKLDFYAQELLREVNTIGSKSQIAKLTQAVVEAKTLVEKIREQVQNVE